ncbi:hypothetical protein HMPREF4655_20030 [Helicobacter pylori 35A]|nr:hypothetical protein HMPREF4655_20030 [Helicobacter pylori 35A]
MGILRVILALKIIAKKAFLQTKRAYQFAMTLKSTKTTNAI